MQLQIRISKLYSEDLYGLYCKTFIRFVLYCVYNCRMQLSHATVACKCGKLLSCRVTLYNSSCKHIACDSCKHIACDSCKQKLYSVNQPIQQRVKCTITKQYKMNLSKPTLTTIMIKVNNSPSIAVCN